MRSRQSAQEPAHVDDPAQEESSRVIVAVVLVARSLQVPGSAGNYCQSDGPLQFRVPLRS